MSTPPLCFGMQSDSLPNRNITLLLRAEYMYFCPGCMSYDILRKSTQDGYAGGLFIYHNTSLVTSSLGQPRTLGACINPALNYRNLKMAFSE